MLNKLTIKGNIVDVIWKRIYKGIVYIENETIVKIEEKDVEEDIYIMPGFINSHVHVESSMLTPASFAEIAVKHGTVAVVSDPHEIANVCGNDGINFMLQSGKKTPLKFFFGAPSCVPATSFETSGHTLTSKDIDNLLKRDDIYFLSEMMNFPGVIYEDSEVLKKIELAHKYKKKIDGHAPGLSGNDLKKYVNAGISTDHECITIEEAIEKIKLGIKIQIREGSAAKNFESLYKLIDLYPEMLMLCTDDSHPDDLLNGHINLLVKRALKNNLDLFNVLRSVSYNVVNHYNIDVGLLQAGDKADFIIVDNLKSLNIEKTFINGNIVYDGKSTIFTNKETTIINNFNCNKINESDIKIENTGEKIKVINIIEGELFTQSFIYSHKQTGKYISSNINDDILKIVVVNRYKSSRPIIGFIKNFGLTKGAIAGSIAHDSHNIIAVGTTDNEIVNAINKIIEIKGGIVVCNNDQTDFLKLEIAGLMTNENVYSVAKKYESLDFKAKTLGAKLKAPFMTLSFMALLVIPELKIGDKGLFDGKKFELTSLFEN